jgi:esterase/lipase
MVEDLDAFVRHIEREYGIAPENMVLVANSVGAVIAATWLHDYAARVRGVVMAAAAFEIKLYVPLAKPALRLALRFKPDLAVTSYVRSSMLTHSRDEAAAYDNDPLIAKSISARVLVDLADTARRVLDDAAAIDTPLLMLAADKDYVVSLAPQKRFFDSVSSPLKRFVQLENCHHAVLYERDMRPAVEACRAFIDECFATPLPADEHYAQADRASAGARRYAAALRGEGGTGLARAAYQIQRALLDLLGPLSDGMRIGLEHGFDSGASLDYVYRNRAGGKLLLGALIDRGYLDAVGWRGIRLRKVHMQQALGRLIEAHGGDAPLRILDVAAGSGRYVLETVKRFQTVPMAITLRDFVPHNLEQAGLLAQQLGLSQQVEYQQRDAFDPASYPASEGQYDIVIVSGLYELFAENAPVRRSLQAIGAALAEGGHLVYTGQPWHPQLDMIAQTLDNHQGQPWVMRPRPQAELDALVRAAGLRKTGTHIGLEGIFTVSVARKPAAPGAGG